MRQKVKKENYWIGRMKKKKNPTEIGYVRKKKEKRKKGMSENSEDQNSWKTKVAETEGIKE